MVFLRGGGLQNGRGGRGGCEVNYSYEKKGGGGGAKSLYVVA